MAASPDAVVHPRAVMVAHCHADATETAVLRPGWLGQVTCHTDVAWSKEHMIVWIVTKSCLMSCLSDVMTVMSSAMPCEDVRQSQQEWNW